MCSANLPFDYKKALEPGVENLPASQSLTELEVLYSIAISLKRIADLQRLKWELSCDCEDEGELDEDEY